MVISTQCQLRWECKSVLISKTTRNAKCDYSRSSKYWHIYQGATALKRKVSPEPFVGSGIFETTDTQWRQAFAQTFFISMALINGLQYLNNAGGASSSLVQRELLLV